MSEKMYTVSRLVDLRITQDANNTSSTGRDTVSQGPKLHCFLNVKDSLS